MKHMLNMIRVGLLLAVCGVAGAQGQPAESDQSVESDPPVEIEMNTTAGQVRLELYPGRAPVSVANFLKYVDGGYYDGASFYRVVRQDNQARTPIKIEVIQGGRGFAAAEEAPFAPIAHETTKQTGLRHTTGVISMARLDPGTATSEFFICVTDQPALDYGGRRNPDGQGFAAFGKVIDGMDVVRHIQGLPTIPPKKGEQDYTGGQILKDPVRILEVRRVQSR